MNTNDSNKEPEEEEEFREEALSNLSTPDDLDVPFTPFSLNVFLAWLGLAFLGCALAAWLFFGAIPLSFEGVGVLLSAKGLFTLHAEGTGEVKKISAAPGQKVKKEEPIIEFLDLPPIKSPYEGMVLEVATSPGSKVTPGLPLAYLERFSNDPNKMVVFAYIPVELGKQVLLGELVEIELSNVKAAEYGEMVGKIIDISPYPVSNMEIKKTLQNEGLVEYLTQSHQVVVQLIIEPLLDSSTPTGFKWTSGPGPKIALTTGTVCTIKGIVGHVKPLYYFFSLWRWEKLKIQLSHQLSKKIKK